MPFSTYAKSQPRKKKNGQYKKYPATVKQVKSQVQTLKKKVRKLQLSPEVKYFDVSNSAQTVTTTGYVNSLQGISQGTGPNERIGDKLQLLSNFFRLAMSVNATATTNFLRVIIFRDKQANLSGAPGVTDVLQTASYLSPLNNSYSMRFKVYFDKTYAMDAESAGTQVDKIFRKMRFQTEYSTSSTGIRTNNLCILMISDQATNGPTVSWYNRVKFRDN